jgi:hypothetical protein
VERVENARAPRSAILRRRDEKGPSDSAGSYLMLMVVPRRRAIRTLKGWVTSVLLDTGAIRECEEHGWMIDRTDPHARDRALSVARRDRPFGVPPNEAITAVEDFLASISDTCPECPPVRF